MYVVLHRRKVGYKYSIASSKKDRQTYKCGGKEGKKTESVYFKTVYHVKQKILSSYKM